MPVAVMTVMDSELATGMCFVWNVPLKIFPEHLHVGWPAITIYRFAYLVANCKLYVCEAMLSEWVGTIAINKQKDSKSLYN